MADAGSGESSMGVRSRNGVGRTAPREILALVSAALVIAAAFVVLTVSERHRLEGVSHQPVYVTATGRDYHWEFQSSADITRTASEVRSDELDVPAGKLVVVELSSEDYIYVMMIPELDVNQICVPGMTHTVEFRAPEEGRFDMLLGSFCGMPFGHDGIMGTLIVEPSSEAGGGQ